jgi:hypothetical protein
VNDQTDPPSEATLAAARARYMAAAHAMQTGVAAKMQREPAETTPKHLRVGVNSAMVGNAALAKLLIEKGIFTEAEYFQAQADAMEAERDAYATGLGPGVTLA